MADDKPAPGELDFRDQPAAGEDGPRIALLTQYTKDLSFENPHAPRSVMEAGDEPHGELRIQVRVRKLADEDYEVAVEFQVEGKKADEVAFIVELNYAGLFRLSGFSEDDLNRALMVECPRIIYPFARRIVADTVRDGGFPQLMLGPIDFMQLYKMRGADQPTDDQSAGEESTGARTAPAPNA